METAVAHRTPVPAPAGTGDSADNRQTSPGTFAYDGNGAPTTYKGSSLVFDVESRMTSVQVGIDAQSNGYRSDGLRAWKGWNVVLPQGENDAVALGTYFYYDGGFPVLETSSSGTLTAINVFAPDGLVSRKVSGAWRHYQLDAQGSVTHRLRDDETVLNNSKYDAYGMHVSECSRTWVQSGEGRHESWRRSRFTHATREGENE